MHSLSELYLKGLGVTRDYAKAQAWNKRAAAGTHAE
jgi:TPR repeat protein